MSDEYVEGDPTGVPAEDGYTEQPEQEPRSYLELDDDVANRYVRVRVDGVDEEVPLREALSGYSRTADYTRKTQELAQQRQEAEYALAVQRALQASPEETLRLLGRQYGLNFDQPPPAAVSSRNPYIDDDDDNVYLSPVEKRLAQVEQQNRQINETWERERAEQHLQQSIGDLKQRYQADDSLIREVVGIALQNGQGPESFDMIYKSVAFDRAVAARQQALAQQQATDRQRQAAGANASQLIGNGASATRAAAPAPDTSGRNLSLSEAFDQAWRDHT